ncbi:MAG: hypothetical protein JXB50_06550 [Spirochaetes bacterium]|nr:hypothetical protein [Spirochaetota bacterium]
MRLNKLIKNFLLLLLISYPCFTDEISLKDYKLNSDSKGFGFVTEDCDLYTLENYSLKTIRSISKYTIIKITSELIRPQFIIGSNYYKMKFNDSEVFINSDCVKLTNEKHAKKYIINLKKLNAYSEPDLYEKKNIINLKKGQIITRYGTFYDRENNIWELLEINDKTAFIGASDLDRIYYYDEEVKFGMYLFSYIFPLTNIIGFTYYIHPDVPANCASGIFSIIYYPLMVPSAVITLTSIGLFASSAAAYRFDFKNNINLALFCTSISCLGLSYIINLIAGIIYSKLIINYNKKPTVGKVSALFDYDINKDMLSMGFKIRFK